MDLLRPADNRAVRLTSPDFFPSIRTPSPNIGKDLFRRYDLKDRVWSLTWQATMEYYDAREA
jgi:hypothetical protein